MSLSLVAAPATEPLTIAEVKAHLRIDDANGEPAPTSPTATLVALAGAVTAGAHRVLWTFVTADGETEAGGLSNPVTADALHGQIDVTVPIGGSAVVARRGYLTLAGGTIALFCVAIADNTTTTARINVADGALGAQAPTTNTTADPELVAWISAARSTCEVFTHRAFITQTWDTRRDDFPGAYDCWELPKPPLQSVTSVSYVDTNGVLQVWDASNYTVDAPSGPWARAGRLVPNWSVAYPIPRRGPNAVVVRFIAGYGGAAAVPAPIKAAMKLLIGNWWVNREAAAIVRASADVLPLGVDALLWPFKVF